MSIIAACLRGFVQFSIKRRLIKQTFYEAREGEGKRVDEEEKDGEVGEGDALERGKKHALQDIEER